MKLYTEEQVMKAICEARKMKSWWDYEFEFDGEDIINDLTPIELPNDDDMANASNHCKDGQVKVGFLRGVLWYQEQILNQNNLNNGTTTNI